MDKVSRALQPFTAAAVLYAILPNLLFWLATTILSIDRPVFNLDYLFAGLLFALGWRKLATLLLGLFLIIDLIVIAGLLYPFVRLQDITYLLSFLPYAGFVWQAVAAGLAIALLLIIGISYRYGHQTSRLAILLLFNLGIAVHAAHVYSGEVRSDRWYRSDHRLLDSQTEFFIYTRTTNFVDYFSGSGNPLVQIGYKGETATWQQTPLDKLNPKLMLIIAESWGVMNDPRIQEALLAPLLAKQEHFDWIAVGQSKGALATVAAELLELCGLGTHHYNLKAVKEGFENCLPAQLKQLGYSTAAIHGSVGVMYDRVHWYPRAGFDEIHFNETDAWETRCYSFPGTCDSEIMEKYIARAFDGSGKRFVYWLTLNTHALYDKRDLHRDLFDCARYQLIEGSEVCRLNKLHAQFFHQLAETLTQPGMRGVEVIIVGDHPPRLLVQSEQLKHVDNRMVSKVHLRVKD